MAKGWEKISFFRKPSILVLVMFLTFGVFSSTAGLIYPAKKVKAVGPWYDSAWPYRRAITIDNTTGGALANFQIKVTLNNSNFDFGKAKSDGSDIRFTDSDAISLLNYWIENYNAGTQTATIWVKVSSIAASSTATIYIYYGKSTAEAVSNGANTFNLWDDFERAFRSQPLTTATSSQTTPTYDATGHATHPSVVKFVNPWNGYTYWMAMTPYNAGNSAVENPSILGSNDGASWEVPAGLINPLAGQPVGGHNADTELFYDAASNQLWCYYLEMVGSTKLQRKTSSDGVTWSAATTVLNLANNTLLSPSIEKIGNIYHLWYIDSIAGKVIHRTSADGSSWSVAENCSLSYADHVVWHGDVIYVPSKNQFWALMAVYPVGGDSSHLDHFIFFTSTDGITWNRQGTYPATTALSVGFTPAPWDATSLYRPTMIYNPSTDLLEVWYGAYGSGDWHIGYTSRNYVNFLNELDWVPYVNWTETSGAQASWTNSTDQAKRGTYSGKLVQDAVANMKRTKDSPSASDFYLEWDMYDDGDNTAMKLMRVTNGTSNVGVGVYTGKSTTVYVYHDKTSTYTNTAANRSNGWHKFGIKMKSDSGVEFFVDGNSVGTLAGQFNNATKVTVEGYTAASTTFYVDDVRVRKYTSTEPSNSVGAETQVELPAGTVADTVLAQAQKAATITAVQGYKSGVSSATSTFITAVSVLKVTLAKALQATPQNAINLITQFQRDYLTTFNIYTACINFAVETYINTLADIKNNRLIAQVTAAPTSTPSPKFQFTSDLYYGLRGDDVEALQERLIQEGFLDSFCATGYFGPLTRTAVIEYQEVHGIDTSRGGVGRVGPLTRVELNR